MSSRLARSGEREHRLSGSRAAVGAWSAFRQNGTTEFLVAEPLIAFVARSVAVLDGVQVKLLLVAVSTPVPPELRLPIVTVTMLCPLVTA